MCSRMQCNIRVMPSFCMMVYYSTEFNLKWPFLANRHSSILFQVNCLEWNGQGQGTQLSKTKVTFLPASCLSIEYIVLRYILCCFTCSVIFQGILWPWHLTMTIKVPWSNISWFLLYIKHANFEYSHFQGQVV